MSTNSFEVLLSILNLTLMMTIFVVGLIFYFYVGKEHWFGMYWSVFRIMHVEEFEILLLKSILGKNGHSQKPFSIEPTPITP